MNENSAYSEIISALGNVPVLPDVDWAEKSLVILRRAGLSASYVMDLGFSMEELLAAGFSPMDIPGISVH